MPHTNHKPHQHPLTHAIFHKITIYITYIFREVFSFDNNRDGREVSFSKDLEVTKLGDIDDGDRFRASGLGLLVDTLGHHTPKTVNVDSGAKGDIFLDVEVSHTDLKKMTK